MPKRLRRQFGINLPCNDGDVDVHDVWRDQKAGNPNTAFAIVGLASTMLLTHGQRKQIDTLVRNLLDGQAKWSGIETWADANAYTEEIIASLGASKLHQAGRPALGARASKQSRQQQKSG